VTANLALVVHLLGLVLWVGGAVAAAWTAASLVSSGETKALSSIRSALLAVVMPGIVLAFLGGLARLVPGWTAHYAHAPWMHAKLTVALVLAGLHGFLVNRVRKAAQGTAVAPGVFVGIAAAHAVLAVVALALVLFRPGE
jgi:putative membrane protein